jgi:hypothetical protein
MRYITWLMCVTSLFEAWATWHIPQLAPALWLTAALFGLNLNHDIEAHFGHD